MKTIRLVWLAVMMAVVGCGKDAAAQRVERQWRTLEATSTLYLAPAEYAKWWQEVVAECACVPAIDLSSIAWLRVHAPTFECADMLRCYGYYVPSLGEAFVVAADTLRASTIKHEMRHAILGGDPLHQHPSWRLDVALMRAAARPR